MKNDKIYAMADLEKTYNYLNGLNTSLIHSTEYDSLRDGSWNKYHEILGQLVSETGDSMFNEYKVHVRDVGMRTTTIPAVSKGEFQRKVYGATLYLHENYLSETTLAPARNTTTGASSPATVVHQVQENHQSTEVNIEFNVTLVQLSEALTKAEAKHPDPESKENKFIKTVKASLPVAKSSLEIMKLVLDCATKFGLDPKTIASMFG